MAKTFEIKLKKSTIGSIPKHKATIKALGLTKIGQIVEKQDNEAIRGMIKQVSHLVEVI